MKSIGNFIGNPCIQKYHFAYFKVISIFNFEPSLPYSTKDYKNTLLSKNTSFKNTEDQILTLEQWI